MAAEHSGRQQSELRAELSISIANVKANKLTSLVSEAVTHMPPMVRVMDIVSDDLPAEGH